MNDKKEMTARTSSVGADEGSHHLNVTITVYTIMSEISMFFF